MRYTLASRSELAYERQNSPLPGHRPSPKQTSEAARASEKIREKIRLAKRDLARTARQADTAAASSPEPSRETATEVASPRPTALTTFIPAASKSKRAFDLVGALLCLIALAPVMIVLSLMVRRDGGPAIFGHRRIGSDGKTFRCLKFRSMCVDAERRLQDHLAQHPEARAEWERDFKLRDDPRITPLGQFLRRTSLDELPQLFNVLRGEMSLVGPRPIVADEVPRYGDRFVAYSNCRPGITGLWQVSGRNDVSYRARVRLDSFYAARWSFAKDVFILVRTVSVVLRRSGAY